MNKRTALLSTFAAFAAIPLMASTAAAADAQEIHAGDATVHMRLAFGWQF